MFNQNLREARKKMGYTQQYMADSLDLSLNAYQKYEQGEREPSFSTLLKIATMLNVSTDQLLGHFIKNEV